MNAANLIATRSCPNGTAAPRRSTHAWTLMLLPFLSLALSGAAMAGSSDWVWRLQLKVTTDDVSNAGTDDAITVSLNASNSTTLDYDRNDFERGDEYTYELSLDGVWLVGDITRLKLSKSGDDGWKPKSCSLYVNGSCAATLNYSGVWLDNSGSYSRTNTYDLSLKGVWLVGDITRLKLSKSGDDGWKPKNCTLYVNGSCAAALNYSGVWLDNSGSYSRTNTYSLNLSSFSSPNFWTTSGGYTYHYIENPEIDARLTSAVGDAIHDVDGFGIKWGDTGFLKADLDASKVGTWFWLEGTMPDVTISGDVPFTVWMDFILRFSASGNVVSFSMEDITIGIYDNSIFTSDDRYSDLKDSLKNAIEANLEYYFPDLEFPSATPWIAITSYGIKIMK